MRHTIEIKVRGYHLDAFSHVNNARYLEFLEKGRWAAFEKSVDLIKLGRDGYAFTIVNINISYRRAALLNEVLTIETEITQFGKRRAVIHQVIKLKGTATVVADADITFVMFDTRKQKTAILEGEILETLKIV